MEQNIKNNIREEMTREAIAEAILVNEGLADIENEKTIDGEAVKARLAEKYDI